MPPIIETGPGFVNRKAIEEAYHQAKKAQAEGRQSFADAGWRAALAHDPKLLKVLEKGAEITDKMTDEQYGRTMRSPDTRYCDTKGTTEAHLWREAYRLCDEGRPIRNFEWLYGGAAWLCGYGPG